MIDTGLIGLCSDHAGFEIKEFAKRWLESKGLKYEDYGTYSGESCDYPDFAHKLGRAITDDQCRMGIAVCGTGNGINMTLNKYPTVRAALCWVPEIADYARRHNDANILVMPGRYVTEQQAAQILETFFNTEFESGGRHERRVSKIPIKPSVQSYDAATPTLNKNS